MCCVLSFWLEACLKVAALDVARLCSAGVALQTCSNMDIEPVVAASALHSGCISIRTTGQRTSALEISLRKAVLRRVGGFNRVDARH